jgi:hypothetical protein
MAAVERKEPYLPDEIRAYTHASLKENEKNE